LRNRLIIPLVIFTLILSTISFAAEGDPVAISKEDTSSKYQVTAPDGGEIYQGRLVIKTGEGIIVPANPSIPVEVNGRAVTGIASAKAINGGLEGIAGEGCTIDGKPLTPGTKFKFIGSATGTISQGSITNGANTFTTNGNNAQVDLGTGRITLEDGSTIEPSKNGGIIELKYAGDKLDEILMPANAEFITKGELGNNKISSPNEVIVKIARTAEIDPKTLSTNAKVGVVIDLQNLAVPKYIADTKPGTSLTINHLNNNNEPDFSISYTPGKDTNLDPTGKTEIGFSRTLMGTANQLYKAENIEIDTSSLTVKAYDVSVTPKKETASWEVSDWDFTAYYAGAAVSYVGNVIYSIGSSAKSGAIKLGYAIYDPVYSIISGKTEEQIRLERNLIKNQFNQ